MYILSVCISDYIEELLTEVKLLCEKAPADRIIGEDVVPPLCADQGWDQLQFFNQIQIQLFSIHSNTNSNKYPSSNFESNTNTSKYI